MTVRVWCPLQAVKIHFLEVMDHLMSSLLFGSHSSLLWSRGNKLSPALFKSSPKRNFKGNKQAAGVKVRAEVLEIIRKVWPGTTEGVEYQESKPSYNPQDKVRFKHEREKVPMLGHEKIRPHY